MLTLQPKLPWQTSQVTHIDLCFGQHWNESSGAAGKEKDETNSSKLKYIEAMQLVQIMWQRKSEPWLKHRQQREATEFNWCIFTKLLAGINLIQIKEKQRKSHWSLRWSLHCITVFSGLSAIAPTYYDIKTHFLWNKHFESMLRYEAKGRSTHAITRYWSGFVNHLFWELKRPLGMFIYNSWTQQGSLP